MIPCTALPYRYASFALLVALLMALLIALGGCAAVDTASAENDDWPEARAQPWEKLETPPTASVEGWDEEPATSARRGGSGIFDLGYLFYTRHLTQVDGPRCEHRPTCSRYSFEAVGKHGAMIGSFLAVDRLMRGSQSSVIRRLPIYRVHEGTIYFHDPIESNDFFL